MRRTRLSVFWEISQSYGTQEIQQLIRKAKRSFVNGWIRVGTFLKLGNYYQIHAEILVGRSSRKMENVKENFNLLLGTHFPHSQVVSTGVLRVEENGVRVYHNQRWDGERQTNFSLFNAVGRNRIFPAHLKKGVDL